MSPLLAAHLWQSTLFAVAAGLLTLAFRKNRASVRYWLWLSASLKFFLPFALLLSLGLNLGRSLESLMPAARQIAAPAVSYTLEQFSGASFAAVRAPEPDTIHWIPIALLSVWLCGFAAVVLIRFRNWLRVRAAVRASSATNISASVEVRISAGLLEPGVVGLVRPILLLPEGIAERLTPSELNAVLAHELCHIRRRDNLFAAIHMMVEAIFWFHPLVWWIGARLVDERERACDEAVLSQGNQPGVYADAILNICKLYVESPLACVSGVSGAGIRQRIETIMSNRKLQGLNGAKKLLLTAAGTAALAGPIAIGLLIGAGNIPVIHAQPPVAAPPAPIQLAQAQTLPPPIAAPPPAARPTFDVVSIRPCGTGDNAPPPVPGGRGGPGGHSISTSPGRLNVTCMTVWDLMLEAYVRSVSDRPIHSTLGDPQLIRGGPAWAQSDFYTIEAETTDPVGNGPTVGPSPASRAMLGPMLQALLEDRFHLKIRREIEEIPTYALTVAKSGFKLKPMQDGGCIPVDPAKGPARRPAPGETPLCTLGVGSNGPNLTLDAGGMTLSQVSAALSGNLDRPVIDKTGITGIFNVHLEFSRDETTPDRRPPGFRPRPVEPSDIPSAPSIFTVMEKQLGLKLEPDKGPRGYIVIDHLERPSEN